MILLIVSGLRAGAQSMPVVFDKKYGEKVKLENVCLLRDEIVIVGKESGLTPFLSWLDRVGEVIYSKTLAGYSEILQVKQVDETSVLVMGYSMQTKPKAKQAISTARATVFDRQGNIKLDFYLGSEGSSFTTGEALRGGALLLGGYEPISGEKKRGILVKVAPTGEIVYKYASPTGERCAFFEVIGNDAEYLCAAFSSADETGEASVVRLDNAGHPFYTTHLPARGLVFTGLRVSVQDGSAIVIGNSTAEGGIVYKLRPEGDIIFGKTVIPPSGSAYLEHLSVARNGAILLGGNGENKGYISILRGDGTSLYTKAVPGTLAGAAIDPNTAEATVTTFDPTTYRGQFIRVAGTGAVDFERVIDGAFDNIKINNGGEITLLSRREGRVSVYSSFGDPLSGGYIAENKASFYNGTLVAPSGEVVFWDMENRVVKLGHGLYISDVKITKPANGLTTAVFTVNLTGFLTNKEGVPLPVGVAYATRAVTATETDNFTPAKGQLSFIPAKGESSQYSIKQNVEIPIKANNFVEGIKEFQVALSGVTQSYLVKPVGKGIIEDQQAIVKLLRTTDGVENQKDIIYEIGIFKTDGTPLTNATGAGIIFDGSYGEGTADALDFDMGITPRITIPVGKQSGLFGVKTLNDMRYELSKTVVINFDKIHAISGTKVSFESPVLTCVGTVIDQPAMIAATSLGDHRVDNNVVAGFFNLSLHRASDGALLTNTTGSDILVTFTVDDDASARPGTDFVLTNQHDLRINGNGNHSTVTLSGVVLYNTDEVEKNVRMTVENVREPAGALPVSISPQGQKVSFTIKR
ncbi:MAG: hypothetical protein LBI96_03055 [Odoribacteraceae bacterium]|nr:hypothetical protein [Odoribacteraceae bacterium]